MSADHDEIDYIEFGKELDRAVNKVLHLTLPEVAELRTSPDQWCVDRLVFDCIPKTVSVEFLDKKLGIVWRQLSCPVRDNYDGRLGGLTSCSLQPA